MGKPRKFRFFHLTSPEFKLLRIYYRSDDLPYPNRASYITFLLERWHSFRDTHEPNSRKKLYIISDFFPFELERKNKNATRSDGEASSRNDRSEIEICWKKNIKANSKPMCLHSWRSKPKRTRRRLVDDLHILEYGRGEKKLKKRKNEEDRRGGAKEEEEEVKKRWMAR